MKSVFVCVYEFYREFFGCIGFVLILFLFYFHVIALAADTRLAAMQKRDSDMNWRNEAHAVR